MVAAVLRIELVSSRFGLAIAAILARHGLDRDLVEEPDLARAEDNAARRLLLGEHRGYVRSADVYTNFRATCAGTEGSSASRSSRWSSTSTTTIGPSCQAGRE